MSDQHHQTSTPCCSLADNICSWTTICVLIQNVWEEELTHPDEDQVIEVGDIVILDRSLKFTHKDFFGIVISRTASVITVLTPGLSIIKKPSPIPQKIRINKESKVWRDYLLLSAVKRGILTHTN